MSAYRKGFVARAWTGFFHNSAGRPIVFATLASARRFLDRTQFHGIGCTIHRVRTRPGSNGLPDYIVERTPEPS